MRNIVAGGLLVLLCAAGLLCSGCGGESGPQKKRLSVACELPPEHPSPQALMFFEKRLEELSQQTLDVRLFLSGQLGNTIQSVESCQNGNIDLVVVSTGPLSQFVPALNAVSMPYIFRSKPHEYAVVDGTVGQQLNAAIEEIGLLPVGYFDAGSRNVMTKSGPVERPADLAGRKIRVMPSRLMIDTLNAMGASATDMAQGEVYSALQTGLLDGWENNPPTCLSFKMYETGCTHFAWTRHLAIPDVMLLNRDYFTQLTEQEKQWVTQAARDTVNEQRRLWNEGEKQAVARLKDAGMTFNEVDMTAFRSAVEPVYAKYYEKYGATFQQTCEAIRSVQP